MRTLQCLCCVYGVILDLQSPDPEYKVYEGNDDGPDYVPIAAIAVLLGS